MTPVVTLEWGSAAQADKYTYQVSKDQQFTTAGIVAQGEVTVRNASVTVPACNTRYYWRVQGRNDVGAGPWSTIFSFTTGGKMPTSSAGSSPKGNALAGSNDNVTFTWSAAAEATAYHFRVKQSASPFAVVAEDTSVAATSKNIKASALGSGSFTWEVRPKNACGMSGWSTPLAFTLSVTSVDELEDGGFDAIVAPQPAGDDLTIHFSSFMDEAVDVRVLSITGQEMFTRTIAVGTGRSVISVGSVVGLAPGLYTVVLNTTGGTTLSLPMIKQ